MIPEGFQGSICTNNVLPLDVGLTLQLELGCGTKNGVGVAYLHFSYAKTTDRSESPPAYRKRSVDIYAPYVWLYEDYTRVARNVVAHLIHDHVYTPNLALGAPMGWSGLFPHREEIYAFVLKAMRSLPLIPPPPEEVSK